MKTVLKSVLFFSITINYFNILYPYTINQSWYNYEQEFLPNNQQPALSESSDVTQEPNSENKSSRDFVYIIPFSAGMLIASTMIQDEAVKTTLKKLAFILPIARFFSTTRLWVSFITHVPFFGKYVRCTQEQSHAMCNICKIKHVFRELPIIILLLYGFE